MTTELCDLLLFETVLPIPKCPSLYCSLIGFFHNATNLLDFVTIWTVSQGSHRMRKGPYLNDVRKIFELLDPPLPYPQMVLICSKEFTQPPLLLPLFGEPPHPTSVEVMWKYGP